MPLATISLRARTFPAADSVSRAGRNTLRKPKSRWLHPTRRAHQTFLSVGILSTFWNSNRNGASAAGSATPSLEDAPSWAILECLFEGRSHAHDRTVPEDRRRSLPPLRVWRIENGIIPEKSAVDAAIGLRLPGAFSGNPAKLLRDEMLRVPELRDAPVWDSPKRAMNR